MNTYNSNGLSIISDFEIIILRQMDNDIDLIIPIEGRVLNLYIEDMPGFVSRNFQFTEVKSIIIRHTLDRNNRYSTVHFLRSIDMNSALVNFTLNHEDKKIRILDGKYWVDMYIET